MNRGCPPSNQQETKKNCRFHRPEWWRMTEFPTAMPPLHTRLFNTHKQQHVYTPLMYSLFISVLCCTSHWFCYDVDVCLVFAACTHWKDEERKILLLFILSELLTSSCTPLQKGRVSRAWPVFYNSLFDEILYFIEKLPYLSICLFFIADL